MIQIYRRLSLIASRQRIVRVVAQRIPKILTQLSTAKRFSRGFQFNGAYTFSKSEDLFSAEPGSTAGSGRPDVPNSGFSVENDARNLEANFARSDFDRPHRFSLSAVYELPFKNPVLRDIQLCNSSLVGLSASSLLKPVYFVWPSSVLTSRRARRSQMCSSRA
jgi:hypothetical protein